MLLALLLLLVGLALLVVGGEALVRGASALARRLGVAPVIIGLTVVAFGTSTPELVVNLFAALQGKSDVGFGNVVGSNIANIGLLLGMTALYRPLSVHKSIITREIPMMLLTCGVAIALAMDGLWTAQPDVLVRGDGIVLLLLFCVFLYYLIQDARRQQKSDAFLEEAEHAPQVEPVMGLGRATLLILLGLVGLVGGGKLAVDQAIELARAIGVPEVVIALTLVAVGTSLPELVTSVVAARRGQSDLAVGNIVGSNIYNLLFIEGISATVNPVQVPAGGRIDLVVMSAFALVLLPLAMTHQRKLTRWEGALLLAGYAGYVAWLILRDAPK